MHLILADGTKLNHLGATSTTKFIQGANRDTITFEFDNTHSVDELRNIFTELNCEVINIVTDDLETLEDGTENVVYTNNYWEGYVIRTEVSEKMHVVKPATGTTPEVTETRVYVTMAQRTYAETQIASIIETVDILVLENLLA